MSEGEQRARQRSAGATGAVERAPAQAVGPAHRLGGIEGAADAARSPAAVAREVRRGPGSRAAKLAAAA